MSSVYPFDTHVPHIFFQHTGRCDAKELMESDTRVTEISEYTHNDVIIPRHICRAKKEYILHGN